MNAILAALGTVVAPAIDYLGSKLASVGAAFLAGLAVIGAGFSNDQRIIFTNCMAFWQAQYHAHVAAGQSAVEAIELASTATLNEFVKEETAEGSAELRAVITLLSASVRNNL